MPSIEIICIRQNEPILFEDLPFQIYAEDRLISHREPSPLFQADFNALRGCIYHLVKSPKGAYTASSLLDEWWEALRFKAEYVPDLRRILDTLLSASPEGKVLFTSDYQFGLPAKRYMRPLRIRTFWKRHATGKLRANALYSLIQDKPTDRHCVRKPRKTRGESFPGLND